MLVHLSFLWNGFIKTRSFPKHAAIQHHVDVAHILGPNGGIFLCQQLGCGDPGAGGLNESRDMLRVTLLWRSAEVRAMRCLADIIDDDCNVLVLCWRVTPTTPRSVPSVARAS